ncbi:LPD5 domain-containing protein [Endozoicomonas gorgoniicola]|uniref:LPD5 domain-containing protein n=1 Tax=Endozoicomonas gorgoniicola TaxID=1234144 RepID=A0ABT3N4C4_9GAMM|nr:LPD38 domain-containing protein [Endozoicomonas gorgoniicola]MCW7551075.1 LPD5 domain-containing protein [Endozoicomonas gorgoniicola]MCW7556473.1 LPD5 domain-containing protein [Endozoicomonas gorgoniicola]
MSDSKFTIPDDWGQTEEQKPAFNIPDEWGEPEKKSNQQGYGADLVDAAQQGAYSGTADLVSGVEMLLGGDGENAVTDYLRERADQQYEEMSDSGREAMQGFGFEADEDSVTGYGLKDSSSLSGFGLNLASGLGSFAPSMVPGGVAAKGISAFTKGKKAFDVANKVRKAKALGDAEKLRKLKKLESRIDKASSATGFGLTGGAMIGGGGAEQARQNILNASPEELHTLPRFQSLVRQLSDTSEPLTEAEVFRLARDELANEIARDAFNKSAAVGAVSMGVAGPIMEKTIRGGTGLSAFRNTLAGSATEGLQEFSEGVGQTASVNHALNAAGMERDIFEGAIEDGLTGAVVGAGVGGGVAYGGSKINQFRSSSRTPSEAAEQARQEVREQGGDALQQAQAASEAAGSILKQQSFPAELDTEFNVIEEKAETPSGSLSFDDWGQQQGYNQTTESVQHLDSKNWFGQLEQDRRQKPRGVVEYFPPYATNATSQPDLSETAPQAKSYTYENGVNYQSESANGLGLAPFTENYQPDNTVEYSKADELSRGIETDIQQRAEAEQLAAEQQALAQQQAFDKEIADVQAESLPEREQALQQDYPLQKVAGLPDSRLESPQYREYLTEVADIAHQDTVASRRKNLDDDETVLMAIRRHKGLVQGSVEDTIVESLKFKLKSKELKGLPSQYLRKNGGMTLDDMATALYEDGFNIDGREMTVNELSEAIDNELSGRPMFADFQGRSLTDDRYTPKTVTNRITEPAVKAALNGEPLSPVYQREITRLLNEAENDPVFEAPAFLNEQEARIEQERQANALPEGWFEQWEPVNFEEADATIGVDSKDFNDADWKLIAEAQEQILLEEAALHEQQNTIEESNLERTAGQLSARTEANPDTEAGESVRQSVNELQEEASASQTEPEVTPSDFSLETQTEASLQQQAEQQQAAEAAEREAQKQEQQKAEADRERNDFALTGSDSVSDQATARGQADLLSPSNNDQIKKPAEDKASEADSTEKAASQQIEDFGEKIGGARKDVWSSYRESLSNDVDVEAQPLSKTFPEPNYEKLHEAGADIQSLAIIAALRADIPAKPRRTYKLKSWAENVEAARQIASMLVDSQVSSDRVLEAMKQDGNAPEGVINIIPVLAKLEPGQLKAAAGFRIRSGSFSIFNGQQRNPGKPIYYLQDNKGKRNHFDLSSESLTEIQEQVLGFIRGQLEASPGRKGRQTRFDVFRTRGSKTFWVGKKIASGKFVTLKTGFDSAGEATKFLKENQDWLEQELKRKKDVPAHRRSINQDRQGLDYRDGQDVLPETFSEAFSFRGVEFGNWVEQGRRQSDLNRAYDALRDLADVLGIPTQALSLNGDLGLAFGARGRGGKRPAAAHYEPDKIAINLTKNNGPGSLAHEWWHALDNYFSRKRGQPGEFITNNPKKGVFKNNKYQRDDSVRNEVEDAFDAVVNAIENTGLPARSREQDATRSKDYWSTVIEMTARSFENYVIQKLEASGFHNDYLANIVSEQEFGGTPDSYPYLTAKEKESVTRAFDQLFASLKTEATDKGVKLYRLGSGKGIKLNNARLVAHRMKKELGVGVEAVATESDLPDHLQSEIRRDSVSGRVKGIYDPVSGNAFIIADKLDGARDAVKTLLHELVGHKGVRLALGTKLNLSMAGIYRDMPADVRQTIETEYASQLEGLSTGKRKMRVAEEYVARMAESNPQLPLMKRLYSKLRRVLRNVLPSIKWTDADLVELVQAGKRALRKSGNDRGESLYSLESADADSANGSGQQGSRSDFIVTPETWQDLFIRKIQDKFRPLKRTQDALSVNGASPLSEEMDTYLAEELSHGRIEESLRRFENRHVRPLARAIAESSVEREELDLYLYARHAPERNAHIARINDKMPDGGSGMTNAQAADILAHFDAEGKTPELQSLADRVYRINKQRLSILNSAGLEPKEVLKSWNRYQNYIPLKGKGEQVESAVHRQNTGRGFDIRGRESMRAMGRRSMAESPLLHSLAAYEETLVRKEKNEVAKVFLKMVQAHPNKDYWEVFSEDHLDTKRLFDPRTEKVVDRKNPLMRLDRDSYFAVKVNGKEHYIKLADKQLLAAMQNLGPEKLGAVTQMLGRANRFLASLNTSINPEFVISNFSRDIQTAVLNVIAEQDLSDGRIKGQQLATEVVKDIPSAMRGIWRNLREKDGESTEYQRWFNDFREDGGKIGFFGLNDFDVQARRIKELITVAEGGNKGQALEMWGNLRDLVEDSNAAVENAVRLSAYVNARKAGVSRKKAASLAKNLTVNFNRKGELGVYMNALYMFFNAGVQGTAQFVRVMKSKRAQTVAAGLAGASLLLAEWNRMVSGEDDDGENWWDKVPDYVKERNLVIMKWWKDDGSYISVPLPYGYNVFHVAGILTDDLIRGQKSVPEAATEAVKALLGAFNPIGLQDSESTEKAVIKSVSPTVLSPVVQLAVNENFYGAPIYKEGFPGATPRPDSALPMKSTKTLFRDLATWLNEATGGTGFRSGWADISPDSIEHLFEFATGGAGAFVGRTFNAAFGDKKLSELEDREIPFWRKLNGTVSEYRDVQTFYDRLDEVNQYRDEHKSLPASERQEYRAEYDHYLRLSSMARRTRKRLRKLQDRMDFVENSDRPEAEKEALLERLRERMNREVDRFNGEYGELVE